MDNASEQKWFVYIGDKHEGPFSVTEVGQKIKDGLITTEQYVWCEGMADWLPMLDVPEFKSLGPGSAPKAPTPATAKASAGKTTAKTQVKAKQSVTMKSSGKLQTNRMKALMGLFLLVVLGGAVYSLGLIDKTSQDKIANSILTAAEPALDFLGEKIPAIASLVSPLPPIEDVKEDDLKAMKAVAKAKLETGPKGYIALKNTNPMKPSLIVATNLPDGAALEVYLLGNSSKLLNTLSYSLKKSAIIQNKIATIANIVDPSGSPIPRGEYQVIISEAKAELQPEAVKKVLATLAASPRFLGGQEPEQRKIAFAKKIFLGGTEDANFNAKLKAYHDELIAKSNKEIADVKMYFDSLVSQFNLTNNQFSELKKQKNPKMKKKLWDPFHKKWEEFGVQLLQAFQSWSPAVLEKDFIQGKLFLTLIDAGVKVVKFHQIQDRLAKKSVKISSEEDKELSEALAAAQNALSILQSKLDNIIKEPILSSGLPRRVE